MAKSWRGAWPSLLPRPVPSGLLAEPPRLPSSAAPPPPALLPSGPRPPPPRPFLLPLYFISTCHKSVPHTAAAIFVLGHYLWQRGPSGRRADNHGVIECLRAIVEQSRDPSPRHHAGGRAAAGKPVGHSGNLHCPSAWGPDGHGTGDRPRGRSLGHAKGPRSGPVSEGSCGSEKGPHCPAHSTAGHMGTGTQARPPQRLPSGRPCRAFLRPAFSGQQSDLHVQDAGGGLQKGGLEQSREPQATWVGG